MSIKRFLANAIPGNIVILKGQKKNGAVTLTFDDGPYPGNTPKILQTLNTYNIKASFFVNGKAVDEHQDLAKELCRGGHEIGNHFYSHKAVDELSFSELCSEIRKCESSAKDISLNTTKFVRPPYGRIDIKLLWFSIINRMKIALWSYDTEDSFANSLQSAVSHIKANPICPGDIILLHDDSKYVDEIVKFIIHDVRSKGMTFCKLSEII